MTKKTITTEEVRLSLKHALWKHGEDHVVRDCFYELPSELPESTANRCLVGEVLHDVLDEDAFAEVKESPYNTLLIAALVDSGVLSAWGYEFESWVLLEAVAEAQSVQDAGHTWGSAVGAFERVLHEEGA